MNTGRSGLSRTRGAIVVAWLVLVGAGCRISMVRPGSASDPGAASSGDCGGAWEPDSASIGAEIKNRVCRTDDDWVNHQYAVERRHKIFDDRRPDLAMAALNVIDCAETKGFAKVALGLCTYYAELYDDASLRAAIAPLALSDDVKSAFVSASRSGKSRVAAFVADFDPRRKHLYIEVPHGVIEQRRAYFAKHAALYSKLDALEARAKQARAAQKEPRALVDALVAVRGEYLRECGNADCRFDPLVIETTQELVLLGVAANDELLARGENYLLQEPAAGRHLFSVETGTAIYAATEKEARDYASYESAKRTLDATTLAARFGTTPPIQIDPQGDFAGSEQLPDLTAVLGNNDAQWEQVAGVVLSVNEAGKSANGERLARVSFRSVVSSYAIESCHDTDKISSVSFDASGNGAVHYETRCNTIGTQTDVQKVAPVLVPDTEARGLRAGEVLLAFVAKDTRAGLVLQATVKGTSSDDGTGKAKKTPVLQVRSHRFGASASSPRT
jgi:hypothetical protein